MKKITREEYVDLAIIEGVMYDRRVYILPFYDPEINAWIDYFEMPMGESIKVIQYLDEDFQIIDTEYFLEDEFQLKERKH